jgi:hypothetical protein
MLYRKIIFISVLCSYSIIGASEEDTTRASKKPWTIIIFAAADNNLRDFAAHNIKQMANIGSSKNLNIVIHLDIRLIGNRKTTRRYYIEKNHVVHVNLADENKPPMDSGDPQTLISAVKWAIENYPAQHYALIFWNHGTGIIDPVGGRLLNMENLYCYNPDTGLYELDRSISFIDLIERSNQDPKGICWDETTGHYLTNQKLEGALQEICTNYLGGKKFDLIGFDACLMSMLEISEIIKKFAHYQVSSQEVEPGRGWDYSQALSSFNKGVPSAHNLACGIVNAYANIYGRRTGDFTLSALDLGQIPAIEANINQVASFLIEALAADSAPIKNLIRLSKSNAHCTHFDETSYKDLDHFYGNLIHHLTPLAQSPGKLSADLVRATIATLEEGRHLIKKAVIANTTGPNLAKAQGISIYFPERKIHPSYKKTNFARANRWADLLTQIVTG